MVKEKTLTFGNLLFSILLMFLFISFAVVVTLNFRPLYYWDMEHLDIAVNSGLSEDVIRENYDVLIDYNSMFYQGELEFPTLAMSESGRIHFEEVKVIFVAFQYLLLVDLLICAGLLIWHIRKKSFAFLKLTGIVTIIVPAIIGGLIALNWEWVFVTFHEIAFNNDYWIFDPAYDPVITILPDAFFMHCALMILAVVVVCALLCLIVGLLLDKKMAGTMKKVIN